MKITKNVLKIGLGMALVLVIQLVRAQTTITSFPGNGQLTWTNSPGLKGFSVEWASSVTGPWSASWKQLDSKITTNTQSTVSVPMFYRVAQGFTPASVRGVWILSGPANGNMFYIAHEDGILSESAMFNPQCPQGYFTVDPTSGRVTNTFSLRSDGAVAISGTLVGAQQITADTVPGILTNGIIRRLDDATRCTGRWTGNLYPTNVTSGNDTGVHPVSFEVDARGLVTGFIGFAGNPLGRLFALADGTAVGFVYTGEEAYSNPLENYNQIKFSGMLANNVLQGVYFLDEGSHLPRGTFSLTRQ